MRTLRLRHETNYPYIKNKRYIEQMLHFQNKEAYKISLGKLTAITSRKIT